MIPNMKMAITMERGSFSMQSNMVKMKVKKMQPAIINQLTFGGAVTYTNLPKTWPIYEG